MKLEKYMFKDWPFKVDKVELIKINDYISYIANGQIYSSYGEPFKSICEIMKGVDANKLRPIISAYYNFCDE